MDISETTAPKSDQQQFDDFIGGITRTVTVSAVTKGSPEQPVNVELSEFPGRPFRPNKTMRRLLIAAWGTDSAAYVGRSMTLFGNPEVIWAGKAVGGVEIAALSHIDKPLTIPLTVTRGKRKNFTVKPLIMPAARDWLAELALAADNADAIGALGKAASDAGAPAATITAIRDAWNKAKEGQA
jgi:hypothetical protein